MMAYGSLRQLHCAWISVPRLPWSIRHHLKSQKMFLLRACVSAAPLPWGCLCLAAISSYCHFFCCVSIPPWSYNFRQNYHTVSTDSLLAFDAHTSSKMVQKMAGGGQSTGLVAPEQFESRSVPFLIWKTNHEHVSQIILLRHEAALSNLPPLQAFTMGRNSTWNCLELSISSVELGAIENAKHVPTKSSTKLSLTS